MNNESVVNKQYLICYPGGGFNDMMNVILTCYNYALKYNRILVIDTRCLWFNDTIHNYISFNSEIIYKDDLDVLYTELENESIFPLELKGHLKIFKPTFNIEFNCYYYNSTNTRIDLNKKYDETVVVFSNCGFGKDILELLKICKFKCIITEMYKLRRALLPKSDISVHIRNTDYKSDVDTFLKSHNHIFNGKHIFLASDHKDTIDLVKSIYGSNVFSFANIPDNKGKNIHHNHSSIDSREFNIDCIVDFLLLASGDELYYSSKQSSYSRNANALNKNKIILNMCLNLEK